jgi:glycine/D-amino acid oxidase-like deaminating enzyme
MLLHTRQSLWTAAVPIRPETAVLDHDAHGDVLVIGSGIAGAMIAFHLAAAGLNVIVVDRRKLADGSTSASTGLVSYELDVPLVELSQRLGPQKAQAAFLSASAALTDLRQTLGNAQIDCSLYDRDSLYLAGINTYDGLIKAEYTARRSIGLNVEYLEADEIRKRYGLHRACGLRSVGSFEVNPPKLAWGLLAKAIQAGARVFDGVKVEPIDAHRFRTSTGHSISARHIVFASGYEALERLPQLREMCRVVTTFAIATKPIDPQQFWGERALLWEHARPYLYARTTEDNRIIVGGGDEAVPVEHAARHLPEKTRFLLHAIEQLTGLAQLQADAALAGAFVETPDGLPFIGTPAGCPLNHHYALNFGGNGMTFCLLAARVILDRIHGRKNEAAELFSFERNTNASIRRKENACRLAHSMS